MKNWTDKVKGIEVGDTVAYSKSFLQSTGQYTGDIPHARGTVTEVKDLGSTKLAVIDWGNPEIPERVNTANLSKVTSKGIQER